MRNVTVWLIWKSVHDEGVEDCVYLYVSSTDRADVVCEPRIVYRKYYDARFTDDKSVFSNIQVDREVCWAFKVWSNLNLNLTYLSEWECKVRQI